VIKKTHEKAVKTEPANDKKYESGTTVTQSTFFDALITNFMIKVRLSGEALK
jgi:hypothetical protein